jgi:hypothetical protein
LRYKDDKSLFTNFIEYKGLYLIDAIIILPLIFTTYTISTKFFIMSVYNKVWHQRLLHCDMESVNHLSTAADGVKVVKTDKGRTPYGVQGKMAQQTSHRTSAKDRFQQIQDILDNLQDGSKDWMENFDEELDVGLPHLANIDVTPTSKSIQISTEELRQLPKLTPEPFIPSASLAPQQTPSTVASTPQTSATQSSSEVTEPPIVDPTPRSEPQTTAGSSGGERRSGRKKRPTAKRKDMPNQDLRRRAFAVQINDGDDLIDPETTPLAYAFRTAATKTYGHQDDFPPPPES